MFLSVFDIFKIGIGPSSSHTMGPMVAAARFLDLLRRGEERIPGAGPPARVECRLHGSLAFTGKGHATDRAVLLGLLGFDAETIDMDAAEAALAKLRESGRIEPAGLAPLALDPERGVIFDHGPPLPGHANGLVLSAWDADGRLACRETFYSTGGGFVLTEREMRQDVAHAPVDAGVPHPFRSAGEMLRMARESGLSIAGLKRANEMSRMTGPELDRRLDRIWEAMEACIER